MSEQHEAQREGEPDDELPENDVRMSIWDHLEEFRKRLVRAAMALVAGAIFCWIFREQLLAFLIRPYENAWIERGLPGTPELQTLSPTDPFVGYMQLSMLGGILIAAPVIFYQLWAFISPGLYSREKRFVIPFVVFSTVLFLSGVAFCYFAAFPLFFDYFFSLLGPVGESGTLLTQRPTLGYYLDFTTRILLAFGCVFELPLLLSFMAIAGIVTHKQLLSFGRWAILLSFIAGAIITPGGEVTSQIVMSSALIALYFISVGLAFIFGKRPTEDGSESE